MEQARRRTVLCVGGLDPSGGAGILVDSAAVRSLGLHCAVVLALRTVQDGTSFLSIGHGDDEEIAAAATTVLARQDVGAVKTGALGNGRIAGRLAGLLRNNGISILVVDPVLASSSGGALLDAEGLKVMREELIPLAALVTPNLPEAAALCGFSVNDEGGMERAARSILAMGARAVLVKGGHLSGDPADLLSIREGGTMLMRAGRIAGAEVRGTGCFLASFAAGSMALGDSVADAVDAARTAVRGAIASAYAAGDGPRMLCIR